MQRDLKVGLSLGVLVLGVVGALLFRREQVSETPRPTLRTARKIDERIAEGPRTPYMTGQVEFDGDEASHQENVADTDNEPSANGRPAHAVPPSWLKDEEDPFQITRTNQGKFDFRNHPGTESGDMTPLQPKESATRRTTNSSRPAEQTHVIQSGDSLSMLAERYLGSQGRYQEIYDANRDVLTDINRLPLGATIAIPSADKAAAKPVTETAKGNATARSAPSPAEKVRTTITDVSTIEPITPPEDEFDDLQTEKTDETPAKVGNTKVGEVSAPAKVHETKKLFAPSRLPFANQNNLSGTKASRKPAASEASDTTQLKTQLKSAVTGEIETDEASDTRRYQVRKGDSLERISIKVYGTAKRAADIYAANRSLLPRPESLREGQELTLPE